MAKIVALLLLIIGIPVLSQGEPVKRETEVRQSLASFIQAFDNLDWDRFRLAFADDATVFYPRGFPERANGRVEFEKNFRAVFAQIRGDQTHAPYMDLQPRALTVQVFGEVAVATFHLDDRPGYINRRTLVLRRTAEGWKIVHLHASEVLIAPSAKGH